MRLPVLQYPNPILNTRAEVIKNPSLPEIQTLIKDMFETMQAEGGIGLAANQVGQLQRVVVVNIVRQDNTFKTAMINPIIYKTEGERIGAEGCLSFKGKTEVCMVKRAQKIWVTYMDENLTLQNKELDGMAAICVQHEIDHLNGITLNESRIKADEKKV